MDPITRTTTAVVAPTTSAAAESSPTARSRTSSPAIAALVGVLPLRTRSLPVPAVPAAGTAARTATAARSARVAAEAAGLAEPVGPGGDADGIDRSRPRTLSSGVVNDVSPIYR